jgi:hypothetical protein
MCFILLVNCSNHLADKQLKEHQPLKSNIDFICRAERVSAEMILFEIWQVRREKELDIKLMR